MHSLLKYWLAPVLWMAIVFVASGDSESFQHSSRIFGPLVRWLFPHFSEDQVDSAVFLLRKLAHITEFAILAILAWRALEQPSWRKPRPWRWPAALAAVGLVTLYAITDEVHQSLVPTRQGSAVDVLIDFFGACLGLSLAWGLQQVIRARGERNPVN